MPTHEAREKRLSHNVDFAVKHFFFLKMSFFLGGVWSKIDHDVQRFVTLKCYLSLFVALLVTVVYVSLDVGLAIFWGILTFILNWIPNVGAMIASFLPLFIIVISPDTIMSPWSKFMAMVLPMCFHVFVGNFIEPKLFGRKLEMDPVAVIISLSTWGLLWGIVGRTLSTCIYRYRSIDRLVESSFWCHKDRYDFSVLAFDMRLWPWLMNDLVSMI